MISLIIVLGVSPALVNGSLMFSLKVVAITNLISFNSLWCQLFFCLSITFWSKAGTIELGLVGTSLGLESLASYLKFAYPLINLNFEPDLGFFLYNLFNYGLKN